MASNDGDRGGGDGNGGNDSEHKTMEGDTVQILCAHDVLCGRGSGPNDHPGNVNFRKLILSRKAEYLSTTARAEKARIAQEIVEHVQRDLDPPGRFLKKMGPAELTLRGFEKGQDIWVIVDQDTALEKAKQALRQNRDKPLVEDELKRKQAEKAQAQANASLQSGTCSSADPSGNLKTSVTSVSDDSQKSSVHSPATSAGASAASAVSATSAAAAAQCATEQIHNTSTQQGIQYPPSPQRHPGAPYYHAHPPPPVVPPSSSGAYPEGAPHSPMHPYGQYPQYAYPTQYMPPHPGSPQAPTEQATALSPHSPLVPQRAMCNSAERQSLQVADLAQDLLRTTMGPEGVNGEEKGSPPANVEAFPYAFGEPGGGGGHGSSNVTMGSLFSAVSESDFMSANLDPIPVPTNSDPSMSGAGQQPATDAGNNATDQQDVNRRQAYQQQQFQRHPGHMNQNPFQNYRQQQSMRGGLRNSAPYSSTKTDMSLSMSLTELMKEQSGRNMAGCRQPSSAGGMQGIAEGDAGDEGSDNEEGRKTSPQPLSGGSSDKMSGGSSKFSAMSATSVGSGMAASISSTAGKQDGIAVTPRPIELIQEEPDNFNLSAMGASSTSMIKNIFDSASSGSFSQMSVLMSGDDSISEKKPTT